MFSKLVRY